MKARLIKKLDSGSWSGDARLYRCDDGGPLPGYVVVSATVTPITGPETYIFAANGDGDITNWLELNGLFRGELDHEEALRLAGYEVVQ